MYISDKNRAAIERIILEHDAKKAAETITNSVQYYEGKIAELEKEKQELEEKRAALINEPDWKQLYLDLKASLVEDCSNCKFRGVSKYVYPCYGCRDNDGYDHFKKN